MATIRAAVHADLEQLAAIEVAAGARFRDIGLGSIADDPGPTATELAPHLDDGTIWVADHDGTTVGYATASVVDGLGHLDQVSVIPNAAGLGIGRALISTVHDWAAERGFAAVTLTTFTDVAWNGPYYERLGYQTLTEYELGPELRAIRRAETAAGLDIAPRAAMRLTLRPPDSVRT